MQESAVGKIGKGNDRDGKPMKKVTSEQNKSPHDSILDADSAIDSEMKGSKKDQSKQRKKEKQKNAQS